MKTVVIYKSKYGSTEAYAKWIAEELKADLLKSDRVKASDLLQYSTIIYGGGLYAGGLSGIHLLVKNSELLQDRSIFLFTVGASDPTILENITAIRAHLKQALPQPLLEHIQFYHLRGGLHYSKMTILHRTLMSIMIHSLRKKPKESLCDYEQCMIDTLGQDIDFVDKSSIADLVHAVKATMKD